MARSTTTGCISASGVGVFSSADWAADDGSATSGTCSGTGWALCSSGCAALLCAETSGTWIACSEACIALSGFAARGGWRPPLPRVQRPATALPASGHQRQPLAPRQWWRAAAVAASATVARARAGPVPLARVAAVAHAAPLAARARVFQVQGLMSASPRAVALRAPAPSLPAGDAGLARVGRRPPHRGRRGRRRIVLYVLCSLPCHLPGIHRRRALAVGFLQRLLIGLPLAGDRAAMRNSGIPARVPVPPRVRTSVHATCSSSVEVVATGRATPSCPT